MFGYWIVHCSAYPGSKARQPTPSRLFPVPVFQFHLDKTSGMDVQTRRDISRTGEDIEVKLLY